MMEIDLRARIKSVVAAGVAVDWGSASRDKGLPRVVLYRVSGTTDTGVAGKTGMRSTLVQINVMASSYRAANVIRLAIEGGLDGWTSGKIKGVFLQSLRDDDPESDIVDHVFGVQLDFDVLYIN